MNDYTAKEPEFSPLPMQIGLMGPPGGGKTYSALMLAMGMKRVHGGPIVVVDTERRSRGYHKKFGGPFEFLLVELEPPFRPSTFKNAVEAQLKLNPSCIIVDSASDEHEGPGGVIEWHDEEVPKMGGNDFAAWNKPKSDRKRMLGAFRQIKVPMIFCFRAREKTEQKEKDLGNGRKKNVPVTVGWMPVAPMEFVHSLDLVCHLPSSSEGVPVWRMSRADIHQEDDEKSPFLKTVPDQFRKFIGGMNGAITPDLGEYLARWASGENVNKPIDKSAHIAILEAAKAQARLGKAAFTAHWQTLSRDEKDVVQPIMQEMVDLCAKADTVTPQQEGELSDDE